MRCVIVVGYQNLQLADQLTSAGFSWILNTLPSVGKDQSKLTLDDFSVIPPVDGLSGENSLNIHTYDADGQETGNYSYVDQTAIDMNGWADELGATITPGWYTYDSLIYLTPHPVPCGNSVIPFGEGFMVISDCGAQLTCSGEVLSEGKDIPLNDQLTSAGFSWTGNCSPIKIQLEDIAITPPIDGLSGENSVNIHTYDENGAETGNYSYVDQTAIDMNGWTDDQGATITPGWYTYDSLIYLTPYPVPCGDVFVDAGQMFMVISDCGATMTIPSAL